MNVIGYTENGMIRAEVDGVEITVPDDIENRHRQMIADWEALGNTIPTFVPQAPSIPDPISDRQFFQQLAVMGLITQQEALDAVGPGIIPASMDALIEQLPEDQRFPARMIVSGATLFHRYSPLVALLGKLYGLSNAQIDKLWADASVL